MTAGTGINISVFASLIADEIAITLCNRKCESAKKQTDALIAVRRIISAPQGDGRVVARVIPMCAPIDEAVWKGVANVAVTNNKLSEVRIENIKFTL